jgi:hypothetical protein
MKLKIVIKETKIISTQGHRHTQFRQEEIEMSLDKFYNMTVYETIQLADALKPKVGAEIVVEANVDDKHFLAKATKEPSGLNIGYVGAV